MYRRNLPWISIVAAFGLVPAGAMAQQQQRPPQPPAQQQPQKPAKDLVLGSWNLLLIDAVKDDGTHVPLYGPNPDGILMFTADGRYALEVMRSNLKPIASNNPETATADENKAVVVGSLAHFGRYALDEAGKSITFRVDASTFPNFDGTRQKRDITAITDEVMTYNLALPFPGYSHGELVWKKNK